jgi:hypothetical protein
MSAICLTNKVSSMIFSSIEKDYPSWLDKSYLICIFLGWDWWFEEKFDFDDTNLEV